MKRIEVLTLSSLLSTVMLMGASNVAHAQQVPSPEAAVDAAEATAEDATEATTDAAATTADAAEATAESAEATAESVKDAAPAPTDTTAPIVAEETEALVDDKVGAAEELTNDIAEAAPTVTPAPDALPDTSAEKLDETLPEPAAASPTAKPSDKATEEEDSGGSGGSAVTAAGGIVLNDKGFPLGVTFDWGTSVGVGWALPGYKRQPTINPWFNVAPNFQVPKYVDWQPAMAFSTSLTVQIPNLMDASQRAPLTGPNQKRPHISDVGLALVMPGLLADKWVTGISVSPVFRVTAPLSLFSRQMNRLLGFAGNLQATWSTASAPFMQWMPKWLGTFGLQYRFGLSNWTFRGDSPTYDCSDASDPATSPLQAIGDFATGNGGSGDYPLGAPREEERLEGGQCRAPSRQFVGAMGNNFGGFYSVQDPTGGSHTIAVRLGLTNVLIRPLTDRPDLRGKFAANQSFLSTTDFSSGSITYGYQLPIDWNVQFVAGMSSFQTMYDQQGNFYFPWFDWSLGNQSTGFTFDLLFTL